MIVFVFFKHWMLFMDMVGIILPCYIRDKNDIRNLVHRLSKMAINVFANNLVMQGRKETLSSSTQVDVSVDVMTIHH